VKWSHKSAAATILSHQQVGPVLQWAPATNSGVPATTGPFQESFGADPDQLVELGSSGSSGSDTNVLNAATGAVKVHGPVPLDSQLWTVFDGLAIGALDDSASPGQPAVAAYRLSDLHRAWVYKLDPGEEVKA